MKAPGDEGLRPFMNESLGCLNKQNDVINKTALFISVIHRVLNADVAY